MFNTIFLYLILALFPFSVFAQASDIFEAQGLVYTILTRLAELFWVIAVAFFIWGVVKFIGNTNDSAEHEKGKQFMVWGMIAFFVLISLWGIVRILLVDTLGINETGALEYVDKNGLIVF